MQILNVERVKGYAILGWCVLGGVGWDGMGWDGMGWDGNVLIHVECEEIGKIQI